MPMEALHLKKTTKTPAVNFDPVSGKLSMSGISIPENPFDLFYPLQKWVKEYVKAPAPTTEIHLALDYFNTSSSKLIYELLKPFELISASSKVHWYYSADDEETLMAGERYQALLQIPFELVEMAINE